ncbi:pectinesterase inhibitor 9-like [Chenopodium quinoa]|uniref:Pectinesterase inhibitor domain-containing protein n=1 Tax=Chenopodium quinoa TaxID=63459 RepID=A0A803L6H1_CHEQI|nr:pectinesterase inhibitor 9-like [Chenopodium quinoa]
MEKPIFTLFLILSFLLAILSTTIAHHPPRSPTKHNKQPSSFIQSSCGATRYPPLCYQSLSGFGSKIGRSHRQLALTALAVSLSKARSTARFVSRIKNAKGIKHREFEAVKDCIDTMSDGVDQLTRSFEELANLGYTNGEDFMWHMNNVQTWVSTALTDESTCVDGLSDGHTKGGKVKGVVQKRVNSVAQLTSNALALVNRFVSRYKFAKLQV